MNIKLLMIIFTTKKRHCIKRQKFFYKLTLI